VKRGNGTGSANKGTKVVYVNNKKHSCRKKEGTNPRGTQQNKITFATSSWILLFSPLTQRNNPLENPIFLINLINMPKLPPPTPFEKVGPPKLKLETPKLLHV
jgi:hypothetical protein